MDDDLEARLESHSQAFEGLLSLIPAEDYYGRDNSDQWQRKKQTKEEKKAARLAKLDPANRKSAMDVINDNEKKRKRELGIDTEEDQAAKEEAVDSSARPVKKAKQGAKTSGQGDTAAGNAKTKADKRREKRERQKERIDKKRQKTEAKKSRKDTQKQDGPSEGLPQLDALKEMPEDEAAEDASEMDEDAGSEKLDFSGLADEADDSPSSSTPDADSETPDQSANQSTASSATSLETLNEAAGSTINMDSNTSTTRPLQTTSTTTKKILNIPKINTDELQARLKNRIEQLRAQRKADGPGGQPARSRQELLESRRKKSEARKAHKKEVRAQARAEEERLNQQRLQGSGSPLSADIFSPISTPATENNFSFGRIAFEDGGIADTTTGEIRDVSKHKKALKDPKQALEMAKRKEQRLGGYDDEKRTAIEEKDRWLAMKKKAHGERVRDDSSLLKKALKRKEKQKSKSEKEWKDREEGIKKGQEMRQKKREENLAKRKEEKGKKGSGAKKGKPIKKKKQGRAGFEGKF